MKRNWLWSGIVGIALIVALILISIPVNLTITIEGALSLGLSYSSANPGSWLSDYSYRKVINITGQAGAGANYQIVLTVGESADSAGANFTVAGHCTNFPTDIAFTDDDGTTQIDFWHETISLSGTAPNRTATFWIEVPDNLSTNQAIDCYYGKTGQTSLSNGPNTFLLFDDFTYPDSTVVVNEAGTLQVVAPGGVELPNGDLLVAWEHNDETNAGYIGASRYSGGSWGANYSLVNTANLCDVEPQFLVMGSTVYFFYAAENLSDPNLGSYVYYKTSTDNATTWSSATQIASSSKQLVTINNPIVCDSGRIVLPMQYKGTAQLSSTCLYSDSPYSSWVRGGNITESANWYISPSIVEKSNGDLLMYMRSYVLGLLIYQSTSTDEGVTWSAVSSTGIKSAATYPVLEELANGHVLLAWNNIASASPATCSPLTVATSTDDCATFPKKLNIRGYLPGETEDGERQNVFQLANGTICAVFNDAAGDNIYISQLTESVIQNTWEWEIVGNPASNISSSIATITSNSIDDYFRSSGYTANQSVALRFRERDKTSQDYPGITGFGHYSWPATSQYCVLKVPYTDDQYCIAVENSSGRAYSSGVADDNNWHLWDITWLAASSKLYNDAVLKGEVTTYIPNTDLMVSIGWARADIWYSNAFDIDWVLARKYVATEPAFSAAGSEEPLPAPAITNTQNSWALGYAQVNDVRYFSATGSQDDDYATVTNTGNCAVNVAIQGLDMEGGAYDWTLAISAGNQTYSLYANSGNGSSTYNTEVKKSSYSNLVAALVVNGTYLWSMKFTAPTIYNPSDDGAQKTTTVTLVATAS